MGSIGPRGGIKTRPPQSFPEVPPPASQSKSHTLPEDISPFSRPLYRAVHVCRGRRTRLRNTNKKPSVNRESCAPSQERRSKHPHIFLHLPSGMTEDSAQGAAPRRCGAGRAPCLPIS